VPLWQNMAQAGSGAAPELMSTHPSNETRIRELKNRIPVAMPMYESAQASGRKPNCR
jgi:predicted Zn-dependent protease